MTPVPPLLTRAQVLARLERLAGAGEVRAPRVKQQDPDLHRAALAHFGTFARAIRAAGVPKRPRRVLTRDAIIVDLQELHRTGVRMTAVDVVDAGRNDLISSTRRYFGGFTAARAAADIPAPERPPRVVRWGRARVIAAIRDAHERGAPLAHSLVDRELFHAATNSFRTWREAIEAAGLDYDELKLRPHAYSDAQLLEILRAIHRAHPTLTLSQLYLLPPHGNTLRQRFGDLRRAARKIGIRGWPRRGRENRRARARSR